MDGCIEFVGARTSAGYGNVWYDGRNWGAHRLTWFLVHGPIPEGMFVMHICDNPPCINIDHLMLGTPGDNSRDMARKGRWGNQNRDKIVCIHGHQLDEANTYVNKRNGKRGCRTCRIITSHAYYLRMRANQPTSER